MNAIGSLVVEASHTIQVDIDIDRKGQRKWRLLTTYIYAVYVFPKRVTNPNVSTSLPLR